MSFLNKLVTPFVDDILIKLMEMKDFPEEQYEVALENKRLKEELYLKKSKHYDIVFEENIRLQKEIDRLKDENIRRLEFENQSLRLELSNKTSNSYLLLGNAEEELNPLDLTKFVYINNIFKYFTDDGKNGQKIIDDAKFKEYMNKLFPDGNISLLGNEMHISLHKSGRFIGSMSTDLTSYNRVTEIDDWIESKFRNYSDSRGVLFEQD